MIDHASLRKNHRRKNIMPDSINDIDTTNDVQSPSQNGIITNNHQAPTSGDEVTGGNSDSDIPYPFSSQSSFDIEDGRASRRPKSLRTKMLNTLRRNNESDIVEQRVRSLDEYPPGYGKIAAVEDLDTDFSIFRKFGYLHNYSLLYLQDELAEIQDDLERLDRWEFRDGNPKRLISRRKDNASDESRRRELVEKLYTKLAQYDKLLLRMQQIQAMKRPSKRAQRNLHNLISNTQSLVQDEADWVREGPDLAAVGRGNEHSWLNTLLEDLANGISKRMTMAIFSSSEQKIKSGSEDMRLTSADRFDVLIRIVYTVIAAILLLVPVFVLFRLQPLSPDEFRRQSNYQILTVFLFTLAFSALLGIFTRAKRQEVFAATTAYSAVLVVFLGNTSNVMTSH